MLPFKPSSAMLVGFLASLCSPVVLGDILPTDQLLSQVQDAAWFKANVPILDVPDVNISKIYYFRWEVYKEHLLYTGALGGYLATENFEPSDYSGPFGGISAAVGHMIHEGRWLRNQRYGRDIVNYWLNGGGTWPKPNSGDDDRYNDNTDDFAHEYSFWVATSVLAQAAATGDSSFATGHLSNLARAYDKWSTQFDSQLGLYWQVPVWDATEYTAASMRTSGDAYHGGAGYRPTINAYQYGDARAIAQLAGIAGDGRLQSLYQDRASALQQATQSILWDKSAQFFKHCARDNNPGRSLLQDREYMGFIPWQFNLPAGSGDTVAFAQLKDDNGFKATYGPTTLEKRSSLYYSNANGSCCHWNGPSWPFATAGVLAALENLLNDYEPNQYINKGDYFNLIKGYTMTHFQNGQPQVYEAHDPDKDFWVYMNPGGDDDYQHSTFVQNIIAGLIGIRAQVGDNLVVNPLAPIEWPHWGIENVPYHGHNVTVLYDRDGSYYKRGTGVLVFVDGQLKNSSSSLGRVEIVMPSSIAQTISTQVNILANPAGLKDGASASATYTSDTGGSNGGDQASHVIDGSVWRAGIKSNSRWTSYRSTSPTDTVTVRLARANAFNTIRLWFFADGDGVALPNPDYSVQYFDKNGNWNEIPGQSRTGRLSSNSQIEIKFPEIASSSIRVTAKNSKPGSVGWGLSEIEIWTAPIFVIKNNDSSLYMGINSIDDANVVQLSDSTTSSNILWQLVPQSGGWFQIQNRASLKVLSTNGSSSNSTNLVQQVKTGRDDQLWRFQDLSNVASSDVLKKFITGQTAIYNKASGLVAAVAGRSHTSGANVVQFANTPTADHWWSMIPSVPSGSSNIGL